MDIEILNYLKLPNPEIDASQSQPGPTTKTPKRYRAHVFKKWEDLTCAYLGRIFREILQAPIKERRIKNRREVSPKRRTIYGELAFTALVERWNESVVQSALDETQERLEQIQSSSLANTGKLHFTKNVGQCNILDEKKRRQRPDLCVYQEGRHDLSGKFVNLVPGEIKTASKWKSEWIDSDHKPSRKQARKSLAQVTKYLTCEGTRYGFILTDEELVPIRLSKALRDASGGQRRKRNKTKSDARNILDSAGNFEASDKERSASPESVENTEVSSQEAYNDSERLVDLVLEWNRIPWAAEDADGLTINMVLFCLSLLALQSYSIKESGKYTSLGRRKRGQSPEFVEPSAGHQLDEESEDELAATPGKRKADKLIEIDRNRRGSKKLRRLPEYVTSNSPTSAQMRSPPAQASYSGIGSTGVNATPSTSRAAAPIWSPSTPGSSHRSSHRGRQRSAQYTASRNSSFRTDCSSQSTDPSPYPSFQTINS